MGKSYINMEENKKASDAFVELEKKYYDSEFTPLAMLENALLKKKIGELKSADSLFKKIEEKFPDNENAAQAGFERAVIKYTMGDTVEAMKLYSIVADKYMGLEFGDQSRYRLAGFYMMNGLNDSARTHFEIIANSKSDPVLSAEAQYRIGELWKRDNNLENAAIAYAVVRDYFPGVEKWYPLAMINLGEVYELLNQNDKAIDVYKAVMNQYPDDDYGKTVKLRLKRLGQ
jgi:TolA-binding protein